MNSERWAIFNVGKKPFVFTSAVLYFGFWLSHNLGCYASCFTFSPFFFIFNNSSPPSFPISMPDVRR